MKKNTKNGIALNPNFGATQFSLSVYTFSIDARAHTKFRFVLDMKLNYTNPKCCYHNFSIKNANRAFV